jgi:hypothetical protein
VRLEARGNVGGRQLSTEETTDRFDEMSQPSVLSGIDNGKRLKNIKVKPIFDVKHCKLEKWKHQCLCFFTKKHGTIFSRS